MRLLLRQTGVRSGLVTSGGEWLLVHVPADRTATFTTWYANLLIEERITLRALRSLLGARRLFGVDDPETLDGLFERSRDDEREVTDQLGLQTRRAVELLVSAFDRADRDTGGKLLEHVPEYRALRGGARRRHADHLPARRRGARALPRRRPLGRQLRDHTASRPTGRTCRPRNARSARPALRRMAATACDVPRRPRRRRAQPRPHARLRRRPLRSRPLPVPRGRRHDHPARLEPRRPPHPRRPADARGRRPRAGASGGHSASARSASSRSATSTRACSTTPPSAPTHRRSG